MARVTSPLLGKALDRAGLPSAVGLLLNNYFEFVPKGSTCNEGSMVGIITGIRLDVDGVRLRLEVSNRRLAGEPLQHLEFTGRSWFAVLQPEQPQPVKGRPTKEEMASGIEFVRSALPVEVEGTLHLLSTIYKGVE